MTAVNPFAGGGLDRMGPRRTDAAWLAERCADPASRVVVATRDGVLVDPDGTPATVAVSEGPGATAIVATETGMLHGLRMAAPEVDFVAANEAATCRYMKMITLPKLRDALREMKPVVKVPEAIAERARLPIERMVQIR